MALIIMKVSLAADGVLNVHDLGDDGIPIPRNQGIEVIAWELDPVTLPTARFHETGFAPGHTWINTPPPRIFSKPRVSGDGRRLFIEVSHVSEATAGKWVYLLNAHDGVDGSIVYSTTYTANKAEARTTKNPIIINR